MELLEASYLDTVAILGTTFIGFSAIVMLLRQTLGRKLRPFDVLFAHVYMEFGLLISAGALLPPLLAFWHLAPTTVWRLSGALIGVPLLAMAVTYPARRRRATGDPTPFYVRLNVSLLAVFGIVLLTASAGMLRDQTAAALVSVLTASLIFSVGTWLRALSLVPRAR
jgi:hypothetical protein